MLCLIYKTYLIYFQNDSEELPEIKSLHNISSQNETFQSNSTGLREKEVTAGVALARTFEIRGGDGEVGRKRTMQQSNRVD